MLYHLKRKVYYLLTETNAEMAFQAELFLKDNDDWIMKRPIKYAFCLIKMNINQMLNRSKIKKLFPGINALSRVAQRQKVYQISGHIVKTDTLVLDLFDTLFIRVNLDNGKKIYLLNSYMRKVIDVAKSNEVKIIGIGSEAVSQQKTEALLKKFGIELDEIRVPVRKKKKMLIKTLLLEINSGEKDSIAVYPCIVLSSDFENTIKVVKEKYGHAIYYRSIDRMMDMVIGEQSGSSFINLHRAMAGLEIFNGETTHSRIFECAYLAFAPVLYIMMENIKLQKRNRQVIILGDEENIFSSVYQRFYGDAQNVPWSSVAVNVPSTQEEWEKLLEDSPGLEVMFADYVSYSMGFESPHSEINLCKEEFIPQALEHRREDKNAIKAYVERALDGKRQILLVDSMGEEIGLYSFVEIAEELGVDVKVMSVIEYLYEDLSLIREYKKLFSLAVPYLTAIYRDEVGFSYPSSGVNSKKQVIEGAVIKYFEQERIIKKQYSGIELPSKEDAKTVSYIDPSCFRNMTRGGKIV